MNRFSTWRVVLLTSIGLLPMVVIAWILIFEPSRSEISRVACVSFACVVGLGLWWKRHLVTAWHVKWFWRTIAAIVAAFAIYCVATIAYLMFHFWPAKPSSYADSLSLDPAIYSRVNTITSEQLELHAYAYERNQRVDAFPGSSSPPQLADDNGHVPVFRFDGDVFLLTFKWVNSSSGLAISSDPNFRSKIETTSHCFRVKHVTDTVYEWSLDLERPHSNQHETGQD